MSLTPVQKTVVCLSYHARKKVSEEMKRLLENYCIDIVEGPTSCVNPMVVVPISNYSIRIYLDMTLREKCRYSEFFWSVFSAFGLNTEKYIFSLNAGKYGPGKLRIQSLFTQCDLKMKHCTEKDIKIKYKNLRKCYLS